MIKIYKSCMEGVVYTIVVRYHVRVVAEVNIECGVLIHYIFIQIVLIRYYKRWSVLNCSGYFVPLPMGRSL